MYQVGVDKSKNLLKITYAQHVGGHAARGGGDSTSARGGAARLPPADGPERPQFHGSDLRALHQAHDGPV